MLSQLYIENIAVIKEAVIPFAPGFNVFTGETGAGKSILIGAIGAVLGERVSRDLIRTGEEHATVTAVFSPCSPAVLTLLLEMGMPVDEEELHISREIALDGKSSCRVNGRPATAAMLRTLAGELLNIHGQHDNQQLLTPERHLDFIDNFGGFSADLEAYKGAYRLLTELEQEKNALQMDEREKSQRIDLLTYQTEEIEAAQLTIGEEEDLLAQRRKIRNREKIAGALSEAGAILSGEEDVPGLEELLDNLVAKLGVAAGYVSALEEPFSKIEELSYEVRELSRTMEDNLAELEYDPQQTEYVERRLDLIHNLKKKYGSTIQEILETFENAKEELARITHSGERLQALEEQYLVQLAKATDLAATLTLARKKAAEGFKAAVEGELTFLDMPGVRLDVRMAPKKLSPTGADDLELYISPNPGEPPKPLVKIASGGELSRVMLSIKNTMADKDGVDTLIFDEVDAGVSGRAAGKIGQKLRQVSRNRQVICITHLAQVAAFGENHLLIEKKVEQERTFTHVRTLAMDERVSELARIVSGDAITPTALENAREMLMASH